MKSNLAPFHDNSGLENRFPPSLGLARAFETHLKCLLPMAATLLLAAAQAPFQAAEETVWTNPSGSVHVRFHSCETRMCGTVIWASEKAKADSARGGTTQLVGTQLFRDFRASRADVWTGRVFVPDRNRTFTGTGRFVDADTLIVRGCLMSHFGCKSQTWKRVR